MKQLKITLLSALLMSMTAMRTLAFDAIIDDICYDFSETEATVTYYVFGTGNGLLTYNGSVIIPETVTVSPAVEGILLQRRDRSNPNSNVSSNNITRYALYR